MKDRHRERFATYEFTATPDGSDRQMMADVAKLLDLVERGRATALAIVVQVDGETIHIRLSGRFTTSVLKIMREMADHEDGR